MTYQSELNRHLAEYKRAVLGISEPGLYRHRGVDLPYEHILPICHRYRNLLTEAAPLAELFLKNNPTKRHRYFHHLNSSQAFAFNLFFPFFSGGAETASVLLDAFGQQSDLTAWRLEDIPDEREGTNIDAWWKTSDGVQTFCEVKLSETSFGKAKLDEEHLTKLRTIYTERLRDHLGAECLNPVAFFRDYQFYRNVWPMVDTKDSRLVFLVPRANTALWKHLNDLLTSVLPKTRSRISAVAIEDVLRKIAASSNCPTTLQGYGLRLAEKYLVEQN
jgi:hypothetical protein